MHLVLLSLLDYDVHRSNKIKKMKMWTSFDNSVQNEKSNLLRSSGGHSIVKEFPTRKSRRKTSLSLKINLFLHKVIESSNQYLPLEITLDLSLCKCTRELACFFVVLEVVATLPTLGAEGLVELLPLIFIGFAVRFMT